MGPFALWINNTFPQGTQYTWEMDIGQWEDSKAICGCPLPYLSGNPFLFLIFGDVAATDQGSWFISPWDQGGVG